MNRIQQNLVGGLEHFLFSHILGMSSSQLTNSDFSEGWPNHQPETIQYRGCDVDGHSCFRQILSRARSSTRTASFDDLGNSWGTQSQWRDVAFSITKWWVVNVVSSQAFNSKMMGIGLYICGLKKGVCGLVTIHSHGPQNSVLLGFERFTLSSFHSLDPWNLECLKPNKALKKVTSLLAVRF